MKPTQEQILSALNKLVRENKTELKTEKVELGAIDDLSKKTKSAIESFNKMNSGARKAGQIIDKAESEASKLNKTFKDLNIEAKNIESILPLYLKVYRPAGQFTD
jgi:methyl-accepting chemotaxis protein